SLKVAPIIAHIHSDVEIETAIIALGREPGSGLVVVPDDSSSRIARRLYRRRPETTYRRSFCYLTLPERADCSPTDPTRVGPPGVAPPPMWIASCAVRSRAIFLCSFRPSSRWS